MGLTPLMLFTTVLLVARNQRILHAWNARQQDNARRAAAGLPPKTRRRRRKTIADLVTTPPLPRARIHPARRKPAVNTAVTAEHRQGSVSTPGARPGLTKKSPVTHATDTTRPAATAGPRCGP
jgi:hypothetical protein